MTPQQQLSYIHDLHLIVFSVCNCSGPFFTSEEGVVKTGLNCVARQLSTRNKSLLRMGCPIIKKSNVLGLLEPAVLKSTYST